MSESLPKITATHGDLMLRQIRRALEYLEDRAQVGPNITVGPTAPASPKINDIWIVTSGA